MNDKYTSETHLTSVAQLLDGIVSNEIGFLEPCYHTIPRQVLLNLMSDTPLMESVVIWEDTEPSGRMPSKLVLGNTPLTQALYCFSRTSGVMYDPAGSTFDYWTQFDQHATTPILLFKLATPLGVRMETKRMQDSGVTSELLSDLSEHLRTKALATITLRTASLDVIKRIQNAWK